jgi:hypothetical protein
MRDQAPILGSERADPRFVRRRADRRGSPLRPAGRRPGKIAGRQDLELGELLYPWLKFGMVS